MGRAQVAQRGDGRICAVSDPVKLQQAARGERPRYFEDPAVDKVLSITLALAGEVAVLRDRLDTLERLLEERRAVSQAEIDHFMPSAEIRAARDAWRDRFLDVVMRSVRQELESLEMHKDQGEYAHAINLVEQE